MMNEMLDKSGVAYIVSRVFQNAMDAVEERNSNPEDAFLQGRVLAYYEILDTIKNELSARDEDLKYYGLDVILEKTIH